MLPSPRTWLKDAISASGGVAPVSDASGLSRPYVYNLISGRRPITAYAMSKLRPLLAVEDAVWIHAMSVSTQDTEDKFEVEDDVDLGAEGGRDDAIIGHDDVSGDDAEGNT